MFESALVWFRRDLRVDDNTPLYYALSHAQQVCAVFVFDTDILSQLDKDDRRVSFIWHSVAELKQVLADKGGRLFVLHGKASELIPSLAQSLGVGLVVAGEDYEPAARQRDASVEKVLRDQLFRLC